MIEERQSDGAAADEHDGHRSALVLRASPDPYLRFDTCDYSLNPALVRRRVEARGSDREVLATLRDTDEIACRHHESFAKHRTITALEHIRALKASRGQDDVAEPTVEGRPLARYDQLIA